MYKLILYNKKINNKMTKVYKKAAKQLAKMNTKTTILKLKANLKYESMM